VLAFSCFNVKNNDDVASQLKTFEFMTMFLIYYGNMWYDFGMHIMRIDYSKTFIMYF
jgi:hypothetical protein